MKKLSTLLIAVIALASFPQYASAGPLLITDTKNEAAQTPGVQQRVLGGVLDILRKENIGQKIKQIIDKILRGDKTKPDSKQKNRPFPENHKKPKDRAVYI